MAVKLFKVLTWNWVRIHFWSRSQQVSISVCQVTQNRKWINNFEFYIILKYLFCSFFLFDHPKAYGVPGPGIRSKPQLPSICHTCSNAGSITHCAEPGATETLPILLYHSRNSYSIVSNRHLPSGLRLCVPKKLNNFQTTIFINIW